MKMSRLLNTARNYHSYFIGDGAMSTIGYNTSATDFVHRCLSTKTRTTMTSALPPLARSGCTGNSFRSRPCRTLIFQRRRHQPFQKLSSRFPMHLQQQQRQRLQARYFVFDSRKTRKSKRKKDPFKILKVPKESLYKDVKAKFLRIAMNNHPDMHSDDMSEKEQDAMRDKFIEARMAFESLEEDLTDGKAILIEEKIDRESNFDSWFHNETGLKNPFDVNIDPETMKEVAEITEKLGGRQGMERDGGMWALARMVTSAVKSGGDAASILRLESGDVKQRPGAGPGGALRRPRKR